MTRLEKVSIRRPDLPKVELISAYCPHDFGIDDDSYFFEERVECDAPFGCEGCWNKEVDDE